MLKDIVEEQLYLQDMGVSFSYTDTLDAQSRKSLLLFLNDWRQDHPQNPLNL